MKKENLKTISLMAMAIKDETRKYLHHTIFLEIEDGNLFAIITNGNFLIKKIIIDENLMDIVREHGENESISLKFNSVFNCTKKESKNLGIITKIDNQFFVHNHVIEINPLGYINYKSVIPSKFPKKIDNSISLTISMLSDFLSLLKKIEVYDDYISFKFSITNLSPVKIYFSENNLEYAVIMPSSKSRTK
jgi:hypothetical protein